MSEPLEIEDYSQFIQRIRAGDDQAAEELVRLHESEIRLMIRSWLRMRDPRLRRVLDSIDICQSVLASFFVRAAIGEFDIEEPSRLVPLLVGMARNKLAEKVRHHQRRRRDVRRVGGEAPDSAIADSNNESPSEIVSRKELLEMFRVRLTDEEREIARLRALGFDWEAVAAAVGGAPDARRKQLSRALHRVEQQLGIDLSIG